MPLRLVTKKGGGITTRVFASLIMQVILFGRADAGCLTSAGAVGAILTLSGFEFCRVPEEPRTPIYITVYPGVFSMATASSCSNGFAEIPFHTEPRAFEADSTNTTTAGFVCDGELAWNASYDLGCVAIGDQYQVSAWAARQQDQADGSVYTAAIRADGSGCFYMPQALSQDQQLSITTFSVTAFVDRGLDAPNGDSGSAAAGTAEPMLTFAASFTDLPTGSPTISPSASPTISPSLSPTTETPTASPTAAPSVSPSTAPTVSPSTAPTATPTPIGRCHGEPDDADCVRYLTTDCTDTHGSDAIRAACPRLCNVCPPTAAPTAPPTSLPSTFSSVAAPTAPLTTSGPTSGPTASPTTLAELAGANEAAGGNTDDDGGGQFGVYLVTAAGIIVLLGGVAVLAWSRRNRTAKSSVQLNEIAGETGGPGWERQNPAYIGSGQEQGPVLADAAGLYASAGGQSTAVTAGPSMSRLVAAAAAPVVVYGVARAPAAPEPVYDMGNAAIEVATAPVTETGSIYDTAPPVAPPHTGGRGYHLPIDDGRADNRGGHKKPVYKVVGEGGGRAAASSATALGPLYQNQERVVYSEALVSPSGDPSLYIASSRRSQAAGVSYAQIQVTGGPGIYDTVAEDRAQVPDIESQYDEPRARPGSQRYARAWPASAGMPGWLHMELRSREDAEALLTRRAEEGTAAGTGANLLHFLVRPKMGSDTKFVLSVIAQGECFHTMLEPTGPGKPFAINGARAPENGPTLATVVPVAVSQAAARRGGMAARPVLIEETNCAAPATSTSISTSTAGRTTSQRIPHVHAGPAPTMASRASLAERRGGSPLTALAMPLGQQPPPPEQPVGQRQRQRSRAIEVADADAYDTGRAMLGQVLNRAARVVAPGTPTTPVAIMEPTSPGTPGKLRLMLSVLDDMPGSPGSPGSPSRVSAV